MRQHDLLRLRKEAREKAAQADRIRYQSTNVQLLLMLGNQLCTGASTAAKVQE